VFLAVEGPNGVGKSTIVAALVTQLEQRLPIGIAVLATKEPSTSPLGMAARSMEGELTGLALAMACAADRLHHVKAAILPARQRGAWVITDRYVPSSLVLQRLDGLTLDAIWALNQTAPAPDLTIYLEDDPATISRRLAARDQRSRLEHSAREGQELQLYRDARAFLDQRDWRQHIADGRGRTPAAIAAALAELVTAG
jgi:dTMP kinase